MIELTVIAALALGCWLWIARRCGRGGDGLPRELRGAELAFAEQTFRSSRHGLVARLDRAYRVGGELTLVELKTRRRNVVHLSDRIELSVQRLALGDAAAVAVSEIGWVIVQAPNGRRVPHRVRLLDAQQVLALKSRYESILEARAGDPALAPARNRAQCDTCAHLARCARGYRDR